MNIRKNRTDLLWLIAIFIIFVSATIGGMVLHHQNRLITAELKQKNEELQGLQRKIKSLKDPGSQYYNKNQPSFNLTSQPVDRQFLTGMLNGLTQTNHLKIVKFEPFQGSEIIKDFPRFQVFKWKIELSGNYPGFINFLEALASSDRLIAISDLKLASDFKGSTSGSENVYQLVVDLTLDVIAPVSPP